tara:strand:- start:5 stop:190 length:186 start_codon:yes stop_codon:yes gene_type:complete
MVRESIIIALLIILICFLAWFCLELENIRNENYCSAEIQILRDQISDLWYMNNLDQVDIEK